MELLYADDVVLMAELLVEKIQKYKNSSENYYYLFRRKTAVIDNIQHNDNKKVNSQNKIDTRVNLGKAKVMKCVARF